MSDTRIAVIAIIVENIDSVEKMNAILSSYGEHIIGRMGIPHREKILTSSAWFWTLRAM